MKKPKDDIPVDLLREFLDYDPKTGVLTWKLRARIEVSGKDITIGSFESEIEAARAYDKAAKSHFGDFAYTNKKMGLLS